MAPPSTTRRTAQRHTDADSPRVAVALLALASLLLLAFVWIALPRPAEGTSAPVLSVEDAPASTTSLVAAPSRIVLPMPQGDEPPSVRVIVNHREAGVTLDASLANGDGLSLDVAEAGPQATAITVTSERVHVCGRYAGSLVIEATHDRFADDLAVVDVLHAECGEAEPVTVAPSSVNDTSQTWGDEGRAPWVPPPAPPPPPEPEPTEPEPTETAPEPEPEPTTPEPEPEPEPTRTTRPEPEPTATPKPEPEPEPTATTKPEPEPTATAEPTQEPTSDPTSGDGGGTSTASAEPATTEPTDEG